MSSAIIDRMRLSSFYARDVDLNPKW